MRMKSCYDRPSIRAHIILKHIAPDMHQQAGDVKIKQSTGLVNLHGGISNHYSVENKTLDATLDMQTCCGIIGVVMRPCPDGIGPCDARRVLLEGLQILQNRGYDSAGICTLNSEARDQELAISKYASLNSTSDALDRLRASATPGSLDRHSGHNVGIAHTRWATHGAKTDINAHPHADQHGRIAIVHNGVIENASGLKAELVKEYNVKFLSETDTEVIAQLIGVLLDKGQSIMDAIRGAVDRLQGTWGLVIVYRQQPDRIIAVRNGSPMLIGLSEGRTFIASEPSAFSRYTKEIISLENGEIAVVSADGILELSSPSSSPSSSSAILKDRVRLFEEEDVPLSPAPFPHWTIKEIVEQPQAISRSLNFGGRLSSDSTVKLGGLEQNADWLLRIRHLVIAACGTSYYAALYGARMFRHLRSFDSVQVYDAAELQPEDFPPSDAGLLVISQSGETADVMRCLNMAEDASIPRFSIVNTVGSLIARTTSCGVYINAGREMAVASTKAFTCQVTVLALVGLFFSQYRKWSSTQLRQSLISDLHRLPISVGMVLNRTRDLCSNVAEMLVDKSTLFILGKGYGEAIAKEGALKIKELSYLHAEAYSSGALKHGPFALIEQGTPVILIVFNDSSLPLSITAAHEVKSRGAHVIAITDCSRERLSDCADFVIEIPSAGMLTGLLAVVPLQLIAYELSVKKGYSPDKPRNLAKTVTVQ